MRIFPSVSLRAILCPLISGQSLLSFFFFFPGEDVSASKRSVLFVLIPTGPAKPEIHTKRTNSQRFRHLALLIRIPFLFLCYGSCVSA